MKKGLSIIVILVIIVGWLVSGYNGLVKLREDVKVAWANVEGQYQRRLDLIPNLVATVEWAAQFEKTTLESVVNARASASQTNVDITSADALAAYQASQSQVTGALSRLLVTVENYPDLKANQNFLSLQSQLEGTENRIAVARWDYNEVAKIYRTRIQTIPTLFLAKAFNFETFELYEAADGAENAPSIDFDFSGAASE